MDFEAMLGSFELLDLSFPLSAGSPYWKTHLPVVLRPIRMPGSYPDPEHPFYLNLMILSEHTGTHIDAPCHNLAFPGGDRPFGTIGTPPHRSVDQLEVGACSGSAVVVDTSLFATDGPVALITENLCEWEDRFGLIPQGAVVLLNTGYFRKWQDLPAGSAYMDGKWSGFSPEAVEWLSRERGVEILGTDAATIDTAGSEAGTDVHSNACSLGMRIVEGLNYAELERRDLPEPWRFGLLCFPLRLVGGSGSPVRAVAAIGRSGKLGG